MRQPEGYTVNGRETDVCRLIKSIYGLKQAPPVWNMELNDAIIKYGLTRSQHDPCLPSSRIGMDSSPILRGWRHCMWNQQQNTRGLCNLPQEKVRVTDSSCRPIPGPYNQARQNQKNTESFSAGLRFLTTWWQNSRWGAVIQMWSLLSRSCNSAVLWRQRPRRPPTGTPKLDFLIFFEIFFGGGGGGVGAP